MVNIPRQVEVREEKLHDFCANEYVRFQESSLKRDHVKEVSVKRFQDKYNQIFQEMDYKPSYPDNLSIENKNREILGRAINLINRKDLKNFQRMEILNQQIDTLQNRMDYLDQIPDYKNKKLWQSKFNNLKTGIGREMGNMVTKKTEMRKDSDLNSRVPENKGIFKRMWGY